MDGDGKKNLELQFLNFISLIWIKENTVKHFKKVCTGLQSIDGLKSMKPLEIVIKNLDIAFKMFDHLKGQVHAANKNGLQSLLNFWSTEMNCINHL